VAPIHALIVSNKWCFVSTAVCTLYRYPCGRNAPPGGRCLVTVLHRVEIGTSVLAQMQFQVASCLIEEGRSRTARENSEYFKA
jgi:hypothetical protein